MVTLRRKKTEQVTGYFFSGQTHDVTIGNVRAQAGDFIAVGDDGEPNKIIAAEYAAEHFAVVPKRGRPAGGSHGEDERQERIPGA